MHSPKALERSDVCKTHFDKKKKKKNPSIQELRLTSIVSTPHSPSFVNRDHDYTLPSLSGQMAPVHKYTY